jgi:hypothetical protein
MNWFKQNRFLGTFLGVLVFSTLLCVYFLFRERSAAGREGARLKTVTEELIRLRGGTPFPNEENLHMTRAQTRGRRDSLLALEKELKRRTFPKPALQPNEFQAQLRQAVTDVIERARASKAQLPESFYLGFDEYATSLPNSAAAPCLGRQLRAIEWIANTILDAHVDSLQSMMRSPLPEEKAAPAPARTTARGAKDPKTPGTSAGIVDSTSIDIAFSGSPSAVRRILNQIAAANEQAYVIRTLRVRNQVDKGPERGSIEKPAPATAAAVRPEPAGAAGKEQGISFIVGTEHLNVATKIEILRFNFPGTKSR